MPSGADAGERSSGVRRVLAGILAANIVVVIVKFAVGVNTNSLAVFGDAMQSSVDSANNLFAIFVVRLAANAPVAVYSFFYVRFVCLFWFIIAVVVVRSIFVLVRGAVARLVSGAPRVDVTCISVALLVFILVINIVVV